MRKSIIVKLFLLTAGLCSTVIIGLFVAQTVFFEHFYVRQKVDSVQSALQTDFQEEWGEVEDARTAFENEQQFYQRHNTWITQLNTEGNLNYTENFEVVVRLEDGTSANTLLTIPLYTVMDVEELRDENPLPPNFILTPGERVAIEGILINNQLFPQRIARNRASLREESQLENRWLVHKEYKVAEEIGALEYRERYPSVLVEGTIEQVRTPEGADEARYTNTLLLERVKAFQADLLYGDFSDSNDLVLDYEENNVGYKIFVKPLTHPSGNTEYLFAMTSLQPVNEAAGVMRHYYGYIALGAMLLVLLVSFYYARRIARPLLRMNDVTKKMANLDFSARIPVTSDDEIGNLSHSINEVSSLLHAHIIRLEQDIEQEKRLEQTRKEFIASISHELKTPLSVIESGLYIIKDKPASEKRDYYFAAIEDEVQKMNLLITDMLELAKYESGTYKMETVSFRIDHLLERVCAKFASAINGKQLQLYTDFVPVEVIANTLRIEQVIVNFLINAIHYTPEGENILVTTIEKQETVKVCIENKGAQIPADQMSKIWDRFYRVERSRHRSTGGSGLGLAISKQILEMHDSRYGVRNTGDGVLFHFELNKTREV